MHSQCSRPGIHAKEVKRCRYCLTKGGREFPKDHLLYQLSYTALWGRRRESNPGPNVLSPAFKQRVQRFTKNQPTFQQGM